MADIKKILNISYCYCVGKGTNDGNGCGDGNGYGYGSDRCIDYGGGYASGNSYYKGRTDGSGRCRGNGNGYGEDYAFAWTGKIKSINGLEVYKIDHLPTIITRIHGNIAKAYIVKDDLSLRPCYIAKSGEYFAHGDTVREACAELEQKIISYMNPEERIEMFLNHFQDYTKKYPAREFYEWHNTLTGSCTPGRQEFATAHSIDIDTAEYTVQEFIDLTRDAYGGKVIRALEDRLK